MQELDLIALFIRPLNEHRIRYVVSGSVASTLYGVPRVTHDIALVAFLRGEDLRKLMEAYPQPEFYLPPVDIIGAEVAREQRGHFNVIHASTGLKGDFYTAGKDEVNAWAFRNARQYEVGTISVRLAPPEYVIVRKLEYFREGGSQKHLTDIRGMLAVSGDTLDRASLNHWLDRLELAEEWRQVSA